MNSSPEPSLFERLTLAQLRTRTSAKWRAYEPDVLPLFVAEMDVELAPPIVAAVSRAVERGDTGYPYGTGLIEAMAGFARRWGWEIDPELARPVADVMNGMVAALRLVLRPGDALVLTPPVYPPFFALFADQGFRLVMAPLGDDGRLDLDNLDRAFRTAATDGGRVALALANPHNPTGVAHTVAELTAVAQLAAEFGVRVVVDEIHAPLVHSGATFTPYLTVPGGDAGFSVVSASKGWNLAALKSALVITGAAGAADLARMSPEVSHGASGIGVLAHTIALTEAVDWLDELRAGLEINRRLLAELLTDRLPEVGFRSPDATFLAWLDCRPLGLGHDPSAAFLAQGRVALNPGPSFGPGGEGHVRLNFATSRAILTEAIDRLAATARSV